jgi:hypothetical protein
MKLGIVSDTHGLVRPELFPALKGVEHILHLGDVCKYSVLKELARIAPVTAVRGNNDTHGHCGALPETEVYLAGSHYIYMLHNLHDLDLDPAAANFAVVLFGHSHVPNFYERKGVLYFNPGSCGPRRFGLLTLEADGTLTPEIVHLDVR